MQQMWAKVVVALVLAWLSYVDIKKQTIDLVYPLLLGSVGIMCRCIWLHWWTDLLYGSIVCVLLWALSRAMRNGLGEGDLFILEAVLFWMRWDDFLLMVFWSFLLSGMTGLGLMIARKKPKTYRLPFIPFLLFGYIICCLL